FFFFFFQAEDGIRDFHVTGVQTCALPICCRSCRLLLYPLRRLLHALLRLVTGCRCCVRGRRLCPVGGSGACVTGLYPVPGSRRRSEERRVGKGSRSRSWSGR